LKNLESVKGVMHGPYTPLTDEEIAQREEYEYGRTLSGEGRFALQSLHQLSEAGWAWVEAGKGSTEIARHLHNRAQSIHIGLLNGNEGLSAYEQSLLYRTDMT